MGTNVSPRRLCGLAVGAIISLAMIGHVSAASDGVPQAIASKGELTIGLEGTYPPFNYQDASGNLVGFEVDFATDLSKRLGLKPKFTPTKWDGILAALGSGRLDVVINQVTITPERQKTYDFSVPYTISGIQIITRPQDKDKLTSPDKLVGHSVGVGLGTNYEKWLRDNAPGVVIKTYDDDPTKYNDLKAGRIDAVLNDRLVAADFIKKAGGGFVPAGDSFARQEQAVALRKDPTFKSAIDKAIGDMIADGTFKSMSEKWFGIDVSK